MPKNYIGPTVEAAARPVSKSQITHIRELSQAKFGHTDAVFEKWGKPTTRLQASEIIKALQNATGGTIDDIAEATPAGPTTTVDLKRCSRCDEPKTLSDFHNNRTQPDGKARWCKPCTATFSRERRTAKTAAPATKTQSDPAPQVSTIELNHDPIDEDEDQTSPLDVFSNPNLLQLRLIGFLIDGTLDDAANFCETINQLRKETVG